MIQDQTGSGSVVATTLRLPRTLRDEMKIQAIRAGRSFNTHVVMIFNQALGLPEASTETEKTAGVAAPTVSENPNA